MASENNSSVSNALPDDPDDMVIEAGEDDSDEAGELYVLPNGIGAISLGLSLSARNQFNEDEEVVVIERTERARLLRGEIDIWVRGGAAEPRYPLPSRSAEPAPLPVYNSQVAQFGFDEEDEVATEVARFTPDGRLESRRTVQLSKIEDEDDEIIDPFMHSTPGTQVPDANAEEEEEHETRLMQAQDNYSDSTVALKPPPDWEADTRIAPPKSRPQVQAPSTVRLTAEERSLADEEIPLEYEEVTGATRIGPVARLSPTPVVPLQASAAPPLSDRPVPSVPSLARDGVGAPVSSGRGPVARPGAPVRVEKVAVFRRESRNQTHSIGSPFVVAAVLAVVCVVAGYLFLENKRKHDMAALESSAYAAVDSGSRPLIEKSIKALAESSYHTDPRIDALNVLLTWTLYTREGVKAGDAAPDASRLEGVKASDAVPLVLARGEQALFTGNLLAGEKLVYDALRLNEGEPRLAELYGRFALARATYEPGAISEAVTRLEKAVELAEKAGATSEGLQASYSLGLARVGVGAVPTEVFDALLKRAPDFTWAALRQGMAAVPADQPADKADEALRRLLEAYREQLTPRMRAVVQLERARRSLLAGDVKAARDRLIEGRSADETYVPALLLQARILLDLGLVRAANDICTTAFKLAPYDIGLAVVRVEALLANNAVVQAREQLNQLPPEVQEFSQVRLIKAMKDREAGQLPSAQAQLDAALKLVPHDFDLKLEQVMLKLAQKDAAAAAGVEDLKKSLPEVTRPALKPVVAMLEALVSTSNRSTRVKDALKGAQDSPRALLLGGEALLDEGATADAEKALSRARELEGAPRATLLLARIASTTSSRKADAFRFAQEVQQSCGEGPTCDEAARIMEQSK